MVDRRGLVVRGRGDADSLPDQVRAWVSGARVRAAPRAGFDCCAAAAVPTRCLMCMRLL